MAQERREKDKSTKAASVLHKGLEEIARVLAGLGLNVYIIGARSLIVHGIDLARGTRDWDIIIDKPFTPELRDTITRELRSRGYKVQWRKWGFLVEDDIHVDINYAPLTLDNEFKKGVRE